MLALDIAWGPAHARQAVMTSVAGARARAAIGPPMAFLRTFVVPEPSIDPAQRLRAALQLADDGVAVHRARLRRERRQRGWERCAQAHKWAGQLRQPLGEVQE